MDVEKTTEDYLEAMLMMQEQKGYIRSVDVATRLNVTKPSVTYTTKRLKESGYITMDDSGLITLTPAGMEIADRTYTRHKLLTKFLEYIGVDDKTAAEDACKLEHGFSKQSFTKFCQFIEKLEEEHAAESGKSDKDEKK